MTRLKREASDDSLREIGPRSEYIKRYQVYPLQKTRSYKPLQEIVKDNTPIESVTVQKRDFPEHPLEKRQAAKPAPGNLQPEGAHDFTSSYNNQFSDRKGQRRKPFKPEAIRPELEAFDAQPSYRSDYPEWQLPDRRRKEKVEWKPPEEPFVGNSTNMSDFPAHEVSPRTNHRPDNRAVQSDQPFIANSDYQDTFKVHQLPPKVMREREVWTKPTQPFDATTTQQRDFKGEFVPPQRSMRPDREPMRSDEPLGTETTANMSYKAHELPKRHRHEPEQYKRPDGAMDLNTTTSTHFMPHALEKHVIQKPGSSHILRGAGTMSTETNYLGTFTGNTVDRTPIMKPKAEYKPPTVPMDSKTVNRSDFYQHEISPRTSYRPSNEPLQSDQPFDDSTDYKDQFKQYAIAPKPQREKEVYAGPTAPLEDRTTSKDSYQGIYQQKRAAFNPNRVPVHSDVPFEGSTTMNNDFKKYEVTRRQVHKAAEYQKPEGIMDMTTTHTTNFRTHALQRHAVQKPRSSGLLKGTGEMSKDTNYGGDFVHRPSERPKAMKPSNEYEPPVQSMETRTTNQTTFSEKDYSKRQSFRPTNDFVKAEGPFVASTGYQDQFHQHEITPRKMRQREEYQPSVAPLDARTTAKDSYVGTVQPKRGSFRPNQSYVKSEEPFMTDTTSGSSYKPWPAPQRYRHQQNEYVKPEGVMDLTTMNRETYKEVRGERPVAKRHGSSNVLTHMGKFDGVSSYQGDFIPKSIEGRKLVKAKNDYVPSTVPLDTQTEYRTKLIGYVAPKEKSFKPGNALSDTLGQRDVGNPYRVRDPDWREMLNMPPETTTVA